MMMKSFVLACLLAVVAVTASNELSLDAIPALPHEPAPLAALEVSATTPITLEHPTPVLVEQQSTVSQQAEMDSPIGKRPTLMPGQAVDKLDVALNAIKQDILVRNHQINDEKHWVHEVRKIIDTYNKKVARVKSDIAKTKGEVRTLFKKKKQIENLKIQRELEKKLKDATGDLGTLVSALNHVKTKADEFAKTKADIKKTILNIQLQLAKLKGEKNPQKLAQLHAQNADL